MKVIDEYDLAMIREGKTEPLTKIFSDHFKFCVDSITFKTDCPSADAQDFVMDAILVLRDKVIDNSYVNTNVQSYIITVAINKWKNKRRKDLKHLPFRPVLVEQYLNQKNIDEALSETKQKMVNSILMSIDKLEGKCGILLKRHLKDGIPLSFLVEELDYKNKDVIKSTKSRCLKKLRAIISSLT